MNKKVKISVVIPVFNAENYIAELIDGFEQQTFSDWELIIVDDLSTDNTCNIINKYDDDRIKLIIRDKEPKGAQTCRNIGISKVLGKYTIIIDSDDLISKDFLKQRFVYMEEHPLVDYATFKGVSFRKSDNKEIEYGRIWGKNPKRDILECFLKVKYPFGIWNNIYKSNVVKNILFDEKIKIYQDFDFIVRTIISGYRHSFACDSEIDYYYRQGHNGAMTTEFISDEKYKSTKYLFNKTLEQLKMTSDYKKYKRDFYRFFMLQFERVLIGNNKEQIDDFYTFIKNYYGFPYFLKLGIVKLLLKNNNTKKKVHFVMYLFYNPLEIFKWFINKFKK